MGLLFCFIKQFKFIYKSFSGFITQIKNASSERKIRYVPVKNGCRF